MKETVTQNERLQLLGLLVLAQKHIRIERDIEITVGEILGVDPLDLGHFIDAFWEDDQDIDGILKNMGIEVES